MHLYNGILVAQCIVSGMVVMVSGHQHIEHVTEFDKVEKKVQRICLKCSVGLMELIINIVNALIIINKFCLFKTFPVIFLTCHIFQDFPLDSFMPKVQLPFFTAPGACPRKIEIER